MADDLDPAALFGRFADARGLLLAVSGGPDSTALMHLAARWPLPRPPISVASVDHGLRAGSRGIAEAVVARAARLGFEGRVLTWAGPKPDRGLQAQARAARYSLLTCLAGEIGASHLLLAHTRDDQAETVLMRLAAGSGLSGLAGMRIETAQAGLVVARPLLAFPKAMLVRLCERETWSFVSDPANADPRFARTRWRRLSPALAAEGMTAERLGRFADRAARAVAALDEAALQAAERAALPSTGAERCFDAEALLGQPDEIVLRVLDQALSRLAPAVPPRLDRLEACVVALRATHRAGPRWRRTLRGCILDLQGSRLCLRCEAGRRRGRYGPG